MAIDRNQLPVAFAEDGDVLVNFGILSGREATQPELDRLALAFSQTGAGAEMTITAESAGSDAPLRIGRSAAHRLDRSAR